MSLGLCRKLASGSLNDGTPSSCGAFLIFQQISGTPASPDFLDSLLGSLTVALGRVALGIEAGRFGRIDVGDQQALFAIGQVLETQAIG